LHEASLSPIHISAALSAAAKLDTGGLSRGQQQRHSHHSSPQQQQHWRQQQQLAALVDNLLQQFVLQLPDARMLEMSCMVGSLARLGYDCQPREDDRHNNRHGIEALQAMLDASRDLMLLDMQQQRQREQESALQQPCKQQLAVQQQPHAVNHLMTADHAELFDNKALLQLAWGLARLGVIPDPAWLQGFEAQTLHRWVSAITSTAAVGAAQPGDGCSCTEQQHKPGVGSGQGVREC